ncbi:hypothetical protein SLEP1_g646 [Rubroshorea leprosula]|uniref:Uncharacterized protein n=1 Tax=Rubroshorea leprosula TaxID=152421 RepID=A0AAV5HGV0_9ROSI|nr:hypothetical protein SLEP1_g646 [Rubroshorea leprosula]
MPSCHLSKRFILGLPVESLTPELLLGTFPVRGTGVTLANDLIGEATSRTMKKTFPRCNTDSGLTTTHGYSNTSGRVTQCFGFFFITSAAVIGCLYISTNLPRYTSFSTPYSPVTTPISLVLISSKSK